MKVKATKEKKMGSPEEKEEERREKVIKGSRVTGCGGGGINENEKNGKTVVVGVRMDAQSRELLTWSLVKVAQTGDRVIALHVLPNAAAATASSAIERLDPDGKSSSSSSSSSLISLFKSFDSVLAVYEGFCNLKQIDMKLKICRGSSLRKVLVREANGFAAAKLILGVAKNNRTLGSSSTSIAKYCAKKLHRDCSVLAVNNGKIVFQREAPPSVCCFQSTEHNMTKDHSRLANLLSTIPHNSSKNLKVADRSDRDFSLAIKGQAEEKIANSSSLSHRSRGANANNLSSGESTKSDCSFCASISEPARRGSSSPCTQSNEEDQSLAMEPKIEGSPSSLSLLVKELPELRPGWPLLRRAVLHDKKIASERSKISVVQWAMRLPTRYSVSAAVHPDRKPMKSEANATPNLDSECGAIVPVGTDASHPSDAVHNEEPVKLPKELVSLHVKYSSKCRLFSYQELSRATSNFSAEMLVGKGGNSRVFKGRLPDGKELAVKILKPSDDVLKEFILEIDIITTLHHKNIISLFGFCFENDNLILVYDFLSRGSLEENLHGTKDDKNSLGWAQRYDVAMGVAEALDYLHGAGSAQPVIHRDVKSSNILLSDDFNPQLSDFGLAKWASSSSSHITCSDVVGTFGYLAPEYFMYGKVNEKVDVYAFGVVLLELLSGRKPINTDCPKGQESLVMWARPILQSGKVSQLLDPSLGDKYDSDQMERMILAASLCIRRAPRSRPRIALVLKLLQGDDDVIKWAKLQINTSEENDGLDDEAAYSSTNIQSHLNLALLDVEDDSLSISSTEHTVDYITAHGSLEDYLQGRWSRSSSFD